MSSMGGTKLAAEAMTKADKAKPANPRTKPARKRIAKSRTVWDGFVGSAVHMSAIPCSLEGGDRDHIGDVFGGAAA